MGGIIMENPVGLDGMEFVEYSGAKAGHFHELFDKLGFKSIAKHKTKDISLYRQGGINFVLNKETGTFAEKFGTEHGPCACSTGFRVKDKDEAFKTALERGAIAFEGGVEQKGGFDYPAIYGIGDSLVYFVDDYDKGKSIFAKDFEFSAEENKGYGMLLIDHLTNNVPQGEMQKWCDFYEKIFNFKEKKFFDIKGSKTGLISKVMRSPCGKITIPINEPSDEKSQIQEYINEYKGSGIQHIALLTTDIINTVSHLRERGIKFLETPDTYYEVLKERLPVITEDVSTLKDLRILADGDEKGYLLQIFTQNVIGPIFFEIIQRKNHDGFGEGNFQALFDAIERDQARRGVL